MDCNPLVTDPRQVPQDALTVFIQVAIPSPLRALFDYLPPEDNRQPILPGMRLEVPFGTRILVGVAVAVVSRSDVPRDKLKRIISLLDQVPIIPSDVFQLCQWAASYYHYHLGKTLMLAIPKKLRQRNQRKKRQCSKTASKATENRPFTAYQPLCQPARLTLNREQQQAVDTVISRLSQFAPLLLDGITGSGKTEVYLQSIAAALARGQQSLVLVPEIGLTPQTVERFKQRFNTPVVCLHSGLNDSERLAGWQQAAGGYAGVLIATRSGVFTPLPQLGLIIVDEEHDSAYKQQDTLRYHARDLAIYRAKQRQCPVILGSATPSLEVLHHARTGRFLHLPLRTRAGNACPPTLELIDARRQPLQDGLAPAVIARLAQHLNQGDQVMVFLNRRGYAPTVICHHCGTVVDCRHCDAHMTLHRQPAHLRCHHCDYQTPIPTHCAHCANTTIQPVGQGTERIEQTLAALLPQYPVLRIDRDSTRKKQALADLLATIQTGEPSVLLGTQMLAKGHHFPAVTLVVMLNADAGLFSTDFRGTERTGQLIVQVAGRAGRGDRPGHVLIQTHNPQHQALQLLIHHGYAALAEDLFKQRTVLQLPPMGYLALISAESPHIQDGERLLRQLKQPGHGLDETANGTLLGPIPAPLGKKQGRYRWQLLVQSTTRGHRHRIVQVLLGQLETIKLPRYLRWQVDIDPQELG